jgi:uncharacterized membrane protein
MILQLNITGWLMIVLAIIHVVFPKRFDWKKECGSLSLINRQMMYIHTFFIALVVFLMGALCVSSADDLVNTSLGQKVCLGLFVFWGARLVIQFFGYSPELWRGKRFETIVHILFSLLWIYFSLVFFGVYYGYSA